MNSHVATEDAEGNISVQEAPKKQRNRLNKEQEKNLQNGVLEKYNEGVPVLAIQKELNLSKSKFDGILAELFMAGQITQRELKNTVLAKHQVLSKIKSFLEDFENNDLFEIDTQDNGIIITLYMDTHKGETEHDISR